MLLRSRTVCVIVSLFCLGEFVSSWVSVIKGTQQRPEPIAEAFSLVMGVLLFYVVWESTFWADRIVLGSLAGMTAVTAAHALHFSPVTMLALDVVRALLWLIAAWASLTVMFTGLMPASREREQS